MSSNAVGYEIKETTEKDGSFELRLVVEGKEIARAAVDADTLTQLKETFGMSHDDVRHELRHALPDVLTAHGSFAQIRRLTEDASKSLVFSAQFISRIRDEVSTGVVWYDVTKSVTGPESVPPVVRNRLRHEVHRKLTETGSTARAIVEMQDGQS